MAGEPLVLVVEDEPAQREVLAYNIRAEGFDVVTASAGDEAHTANISEIHHPVHGGATGAHAGVGLVRGVLSDVRIRANITEFSLVRVWNSRPAACIFISSERRQQDALLTDTQTKGRDGRCPHTHR